jgi:hypothetical protein
LMMLVHADAIHAGFRRIDQLVKRPVVILSTFRRHQVHSTADPPTNGIVVRNRPADPGTA